MRSYPSSPQQPDTNDLVWPHTVSRRIKAPLTSLIKHLRWYLTHPNIPRIGLLHVLEAVESHVGRTLDAYSPDQDTKIFRTLLLHIREHISHDSNASDNDVWQNALSEFLGFAIKLQIIAAQSSTDDPRSTRQGAAGDNRSRSLNALKLKDIEKEILLAIGDQTLTCKEIASKSGKFSDNGHLRGALSHLKKKRGILDSPGRGYFIRDEYHWVLTALSASADVSA